MGACNSKKNAPSKNRNTQPTTTRGPVSQWSVSDVYNWLSTACDGELAAMARTFKKHKIDGQMLIKLTDEQLNAMGISPDHQNRLKLLLKVQLSLDIKEEKVEEDPAHVKTKGITKLPNSNQHLQLKPDYVTTDISIKAQHKAKKLDDIILSEMADVATKVAAEEFSGNSNNGERAHNGGNNGNSSSQRATNTNNTNKTNNSSQRSSNSHNSSNNSLGGNGYGNGGGNGDGDDGKKRNNNSNWNYINEAEEEEEDEDEDEMDDEDEKERELSASSSSLNPRASPYLETIDEGDTDRYNSMSVRSEDKKDEIQRLWSKLANAANNQSLNSMQNIMNQIQSLTIKEMEGNNNTKGSKKQSKKKNKKSSDLIVFNYDPIDSKRGKGNWSIPNNLTKAMPEMVKEGISDFRAYIDKSIALQQYDGNIYEDVDICVVNLDLHHKQKQNENLYLVAKIIKNVKENRNYQWIKPDISTAKEMKSKHNVSRDKLPASSRDKLEIMDMNKVQTMISEFYVEEKLIITGSAQKKRGKKQTKWHKLKVWNVKNKSNDNKWNENKWRITLSLKKEEFISKLKEFLKDNTDYKIIPIIMFDNDNKKKDKKMKYDIHYVHIIEIMDNDIGISYKYNKQRNYMIPTGIHLDRIEILKMHELAIPDDTNKKCQYLDDFKSNITHLTVGNPDDQINLIKSLQTQIEKQKEEIIELKKKNNKLSATTTSLATTPSDNEQCNISHHVSFTSTPSIPNEYSYSNNDVYGTKQFLFSPNLQQFQQSQQFQQINIQNSLSVPNLNQFICVNNNNYGYYQNIQ